MSSNQIIFTFLFSLFLSSCGVKSDPIPPQDTLLPSFEKQYISVPKKELQSSEVSKEQSDEDSLEKKKSHP